MVDGEEILDCVWYVDEILSEVEEAIVQKNHTLALHRLKEARAAIDELREDDEAEDDRQEVDMHVTENVTKFFK
ncbi:MAG: hypothetical protein ACP5NW_03520 [Candidatus Woesearchaeota archaeon]